MKSYTVKFTGQQAEVIEKASGLCRCEPETLIAGGLAARLDSIEYDLEGVGGLVQDIRQYVDGAAPLADAERDLGLQEMAQ